MASANVIIAMLGTVLGFATSAVVAEVRGDRPAAVSMKIAVSPAQFRRVPSEPAQALVPTSGPVLAVAGWQGGRVAQVRSFVLLQATEMPR